MSPHKFLLAVALMFASALLCRGEIKTTVNYNPNESATSAFKFKDVPSPSKTDAAQDAKFAIVDGERDENGGDLDKLNDGKTPTEEDEPAENFFFNAGTPGGRLLVDLGKVIEVRQINTYSWHPNTRGPQVYKLYASDGLVADFNAKPKETDPEKCGWKLLAKVDTRPKEGTGGGQYAVSVSDSNGPLGKFRYLLFDMSRTETDDDFGNTFYSEIDVIGAGKTSASNGGLPEQEVVEADGGKYQITIDTSDTPELREWAHQQIAPMAIEWYPKIIQMLPSEGYEAPKSFSITFIEDMRGVANTSGTRIRCAASWFKNNLKGEAVGAVFHEMVHVVQQYGRARRENPSARRAPGWLTEGIPDYLRWYKFEPQSHGADITKRNFSRARYDGSYRPTANFLNWVSDKYNKDLAMLLNAAIRTGKYEEPLWAQLTGHTVRDLGAAWKAELQEKLGIEVAATNDDSNATSSTGLNTLTAAEKAAGWKLLFNGKDFSGWHNFKRDDVRPGWQVKDGALVCADPHNAGDIVTSDSFGWFELQLDYNISAGGNSGIMFHVTDEGDSAWRTGPEFQLEDNAKAADPQRCGWLYALYEPPPDPKTGKPLDATKPAGEWNHIRLVISPEKCIHEINGVIYFEYVLGSDDFKERVAKSKFGKMPRFAKADAGFIALQGDHGQVSFRNIKVRAISAPPKNS
jgi:3-keto-disaccharide hydrolase/Peptidase of plants and bacteria